MKRHRKIILLWKGIEKLFYYEKALEFDFAMKMHWKSTLLWWCGHWKKVVDNSGYYVKEYILIRYESLILFGLYLSHDPVHYFTSGDWKVSRRNVLKYTTEMAVLVESKNKGKLVDFSLCESLLYNFWFYYGNKWGLNH